MRDAKITGQINRPWHESVWNEARNRGGWKKLMVATTCLCRGENEAPKRSLEVNCQELRGYLPWPRAGRQLTGYLKWDVEGGKPEVFPRYRFPMVDRKMGGCEDKGGQYAGLLLSLGKGWCGLVLGMGKVAHAAFVGTTPVVEVRVTLVPCFYLKMLPPYFRLNNTLYVTILCLGAIMALELWSYVCVST